MATPELTPEHWTLAPAIVSMGVPDSTDMTIFGQALANAVTAASARSDAFGPTWTMASALYEQFVDPVCEATTLTFAAHTGRPQALAGHRIAVYGLALYLRRGEGRPEYEKLMIRAKRAMDAVLAETGSSETTVLVPIDSEQIRPLAERAVAFFDAA